MIYIGIFKKESACLPLPIPRGLPEARLQPVREGLALLVLHGS
jgi:hypothetical protein